MAAMNAVEVADGNGGAAGRGRQIVEAVVDVHGLTRSGGPSLSRRREWL
jgi:hypothetical protein